METTYIPIFIVKKCRRHFIDIFSEHCTHLLGSLCGGRTGGRSPAPTPPLWRVGDAPGGRDGAGGRGGGRSLLLFHSTGQRLQ